jgi:alanyl-tRNA synthetase
MGGKGGGRADLAQAGAEHPEQLTAAFALARAWLEQRLSAA